MSSAKRSQDEDSNDLDASVKRQKTLTFPLHEAAIEDTILEESGPQGTVLEEQHGVSMEESIIEELAFEEAGRRAMITALKFELDKLYSDFDLIVQAHAAIGQYTTFTKEVIRENCLLLEGEDCLEYTPAPAKLEEIVMSFVRFPCPKNRSRGLNRLNNRVVYDFVSAIDEGHAVLSQLRLSVHHAITIWSVWKRSAITKALPKATLEELFHISKKVNARIIDQTGMLYELLNTSGPVVAAQRRFRSEMVSDYLQYKRSHVNEDLFLENFDRVYYAKRPSKDKVMKAVRKLYNFRFCEVYSQSGFSTQLFLIEKFMGHQKFDFWRDAKPTTPVNYFGEFGQKSTFGSFYCDLMSFPIIARQLAKEGEGEIGQ
jgi:hypothetical protein